MSGGLPLVEERRLCGKDSQVERLEQQADLETHTHMPSVRRRDRRRWQRMAMSELRWA